MTFHNMLSICVLIAILSTGDCFFSNLMNEPLNFAVSLLDGQAQNGPHPTTALPIHTPGPMTLTGNAATTLSAMPGGHSKYKDIVAKKLTTYIGGASKKTKLPKVEATRHSTDSSSKQSSSISDESSSSKTWKHVRPAPKRPSKKGHNQRIKASLSTGHRHSSHGHTNARPAHSKTSHKLRQSGWKKTSWAANRSSGSSEKYPVVTAKQAKRVGSSSSSEEHVVLVKKTAKPINKLRGSSKKYPVVTAKQAKGVGSSSSSSEEHIIIVKKTAKPINKLGGSSKKSGWKKTSWAANRSSGSSEKYPVVTAKQAKRVGSSSSSEEHVVLVKKTAKPAHSFRASRTQSHRNHNHHAAGGYKPKRRSSPKLRGSGLCNLCRSSY